MQTMMRISMCGRYTLTAPEQLALHFDLDPATVPAMEAHYNIASAQEVPVIVACPDGRLALEWMRWGFQPAWATDSRRPAPINARAETLAERPYFRSAVRQARCLIPAAGFFEWQARRDRGGKQPLYIRHADGGLFALAGLYTDGPLSRGSPARAGLRLPHCDALVQLVRPDRPRHLLWPRPSREAQGTRRSLFKRLARP